MQDRADPHARERAIEIARRDPPVGLSGRAAIAAIEEVLDVIRVPSACRISYDAYRIYDSIEIGSSDQQPPGSLSHRPVFEIDNPVRGRALEFAVAAIAI
jgi:hypothetical protein